MKGGAEGESREERRRGEREESRREREERRRSMEEQEQKQTVHPASCQCNEHAVQVCKEKFEGWVENKLLPVLSGLGYTTSTPRRERRVGREDMFIDA